MSDKFSEEMNIMQLSQWLCNHPKVGTDYQEDINKLKGMIIIILLLPYGQKFSRDPIFTEGPSSKIS